MRPSTILGLLFTCSTAAAQQFVELGVEGRLPTAHRFATLALAGDLEGDGDVDVLLSTDRRNYVLLNDGRGNFTEAPDDRGLSTANLLHGSFADYDGDGDQDLVAGNADFRLFANDGTGRFAEIPGAFPTTLLLSTTPHQIVDIDGDGDLDLYVASAFAHLLFRNDGNNSFTNVIATAFPTARTGWGVAGDLDSDGDVDFLVEVADQLVHLRNDGTGTFADVSATTIPPTAADRIALADADGDGDLDAFVSTAAGTLAALYNDGTGVFAAGPPLPPLPAFARYIDVTDFEHDGDLDLVLRTGDAPTPWTLFANGGGGGFTDVTSIAIAPTEFTPRSVATGDLDGDGTTDLYSANRDGSYSRMLVNDTPGYFRDPSQPRVTWKRTAEGGSAFGDIDGDGDLDLALAVSPQLEIHVNDGAGNFSEQTATRAPAGIGALGVAMTDIDADGDLDLLLAPGAVWRNDGTGHFTDVTSTTLPAVAAGSGRAVATADVDGDGDVDAFVWDPAATTASTLLVNDGSGVFTDELATRLPTIPFAISDAHFLDFDADGDRDLIVNGSSSTAVLIAALVNDGTGYFTDETAARVPAIPQPIRTSVVVDFDGDRDLDLVLSLSPQSGLALENDGTGRFTGRSGVWTPTRWTHFELAAGDLDLDGDQDLIGAGLYVPDDPMLFVYVNNGGVYTDESVLRTDFLNVTPVYHLTLADVDRDRDPDLMIGSGYGRRLFVNRHQQLTSPHEAVVGAPLPIEFHSRPGYSTATSVGYLLLNFLPAPRGIPIPFGTVLIEPTSMIFVGATTIPAPAGTAQTIVPVPNIPSLAGLPLYFQALIADASTPLPNERLTNMAIDLVR
ncbi:MAG: VCBS repeat-containing protein [Planctomycetes bacterium]|nr:VCBS repeat-containing protein [Planctomycetota bacterium]